MIAADICLALLCGTAAACLGAATIMFGLWLKAHLEEEFLSEQLGAATYAAYKAQTPMLVPFIRAAYQSRPHDSRSG
jgi:protein-S-isoprenylcysteine O-methyltransferase Ste14